MGVPSCTTPRARRYESLHALTMLMRPASPQLMAQAKPGFAGPASPWTRAPPERSPRRQAPPPLHPPRPPPLPRDPLPRLALQPLAQPPGPARHVAAVRSGNQHRIARPPDKRCSKSSAVQASCPRIVREEVPKGQDGRGWGNSPQRAQRYGPQRSVPTSARSKKERRLCGTRAIEGRLGHVTTRLLLEHDEQRKSLRAACRGRQTDQHSIAASSFTRKSNVVDFDRRMVWL